MVALLAKKFIKNSGDTASSEVRLAYGTLCGAVGVVLNIILFGIKMMAGILSGSVAIVADAINNLSDAGSSVITMIGFKMSGKEPNPEHPFGHGRIEYITGLVVSFIVILMGIELVKSSFDKIIHPQELVCSATTVIILSASIIIKLYMYGYNHKYAGIFSSAAMNATAVDSFTDSAATALVLLATLISQYMGLKIDGWCGLVVSLFILYAGFSSAKDTLNPLLGTKADPEFVEQIEKFAQSYDDILGVHDLVVHDYGPGRMMISFHAEVPSNGDIMELHDTIDNMEQRIREVLGAHAVIHMDPVVVDDERISRMRRITELIVKEIYSEITIHDFRMVAGPTHTNLIFDAVVPYEAQLSEEEAREKICEKVAQLPGKHYAVVKIDRPFY